VEDEFLRREIPTTDRESFLALINKAIFVVIIITGLWASTQYFAHKMKYDTGILGKPVLNIGKGIKIYPPVKYPAWVIKYWKPRYAALHPYMKEAGYILIVFFFAGAAAYAILGARWTGKSDRIYGTARWGTRKDIEEAGLLKGKGGIILGQLADAEIRVETDKESNLASLHEQRGSEIISQAGTYNVLLAAPTRSGKGVSSVIPTLLSYPGSVIVLDFKAENFNITSGFRSKFSKIYRYAPVGENGHHFNPMMEIREGKDMFADANLIADILTMPAGGKSRNDGTNEHFRIAALEFLTAAIIHCLTGDWPDKSLSGVASFLSQVDEADPTNKKFIYRQMIVGAHCSAEAHRQVAEGAGNQMKRPDIEGGSVLSTVNNALAVFKDTRIRENSTDSEFGLDEFETTDIPISLYLTIPNSDRERIAPLIRMFILLMSRKFSSGETQAGDRKLKTPVLFILDEFDKLGRYDELHTNMGIHNGYGIHYFLIVQSLHQLNYLYGRDHSFLAHCQNTILYAPGEYESAKLISEMIGKKSVKVRSESSSSAGKYSKSISVQEHSIDIINPDEAMKMTMDKMILLSQSRPPYQGKKCVYYEDERFKGRANIAPAFSSRKELFGMEEEEREKKKEEKNKETEHWYDITPEARMPEKGKERQTGCLTFDAQMKPHADKKEYGKEKKTEAAVETGSESYEGYSGDDDVAGIIEGI
jgi:type IV secretion system protein VirD4